MSNRKKAFVSESANPSTKFLEWKSKKKVFSFYDKNSEAEDKNVEIPLPFTFLVLEEMHTCGGWNDPSESGIFANEVKFIGSEEMTVKSYKGGEIATGLYKDVKTKVNNAGGHYVKSIYAMDVQGEIINIKLKGACVKAWGDFTQKNRTRLVDETIVVSSALDMKKGSVKYSVPVFEFKSSLSNEEAVLADAAYDKLEAYLKLNVKEMEVVDEEPVLADEENMDDVAF